MKNIASIIIAMFMGIALAISGGVLLSGCGDEKLPEKSSVVVEDDSGNKKAEGEATLPERYKYVFDATGGTIVNPRGYQIGDMTVTNFSYGFEVNAAGYLESQNKGVDNSYAMMKIYFFAYESSASFTIRYISNGESNFDYAIFSNLDQTLVESNTADGTYYKSTKGESSTAEKSLTYSNIAYGSHVIYVKYRKDGSVNSGKDSLQLFFENDYYHGQTAKWQYKGMQYGTLPTATKPGYEFKGWYANPDNNMVPPLSEWELVGGATYNASTGVIYFPNADSRIYSPLIYVGDTDINTTLTWHASADFMCPTAATSSSGNMFNGGAAYYNANKVDYSGNGWADRATPGVWTNISFSWPSSTEWLGSDFCQWIQPNFGRSVTYANDPYYMKNVRFWLVEDKGRKIESYHTVESFSTLYAHWEPISYTATLDPNGGELSTEGYNSTEEWNFTGSNSVALGRTYMYEDMIYISAEAYMDDWSQYANSDTMRIISCTEGGGWNIQAYGGVFQFALYDAGNDYALASSDVTCSSLSAGWHKFEMSFDGKRGYLYLDGALIAVSETLQSGRIGYNSTNGIFVGAEAGGNQTTPDGYFVGKVRDLKILHTYKAKTVPYNTPYGSLPSPTRTNYTFDGWYKKQNRLDMDDVMQFFNEKNTSGANNNVLMTKDEDGVYGWAGPTGGYDDNGTWRHYEYKPSTPLVVGGTYKLSYLSRNYDDKTTTALFAGGDITTIAGNLTHTYTNYWKQYETTFVVTGSNVYFTLGYSWGYWTSFKDIFLERIDTDDFEKKNYINMSAFMGYFNEQEIATGDTSELMGKDSDGSYYWYGATGGYHVNGSWTHHCYQTSLPNGTYKLSWDAKNVRTDSNPTTCLYPISTSGESFLYMPTTSNTWKHYEGTFVVNNNFKGWHLGYPYGDKTYFRNIVCERIDIDDFKEVTSTSTYDRVGNQTLYAKWTPVPITITVKMRFINKNGSYSNVDNNAGGKVRVDGYRINGSTSNFVHLANYQTVASASYTVHKGQRVHLYVEPNENCVFAGVSTSSSLSESIKFPSASLSHYYDDYPLVNRTYYVYFKQLSENQLKYDETDKYFYFEDGYYPQSDVNNALELDMSSSNSNVSVSYDNKTDILSLNGTTTSHLMLSAKQMSFKAGQKYRLSMELLSGEANCSEHWAMVLEVSSSPTEFYGGEILNSGRNACETTRGSGTDTFTVVANGENLGQYLTFWIYIGNTLTFNNAKYRLTISPDFNDWLNSSARATGESLTYCDGRNDVNIPVYSCGGERYVKIEKSGTSAWFKFEPIRWRISDYGVANNEKNIERYSTLLQFKNYTSYSSYFVAVSDLILGVGAMNNTRSVREGDSVAGMTGFQNIQNTANGMDLQVHYNLTDDIITIDNYSDYDQNNSVIHDGGLYEEPLRICSTGELDEVGFVNKQAKASDMVAFILGLDKDQVSYWTRDLSNLGAGVAITPTGTQIRPWLDEVLGMRFAYTFKEGSNAGGGILINGQDENVSPHITNCMNLSFDKASNTYTLTTLENNDDPYYVVANHYCNFEAGATYLISANVKTASGEDAKISLHFGTGPWYDKGSVVLSGTNAWAYFTASETGSFYLDLEAEGDYGHTAGAVIKVEDLFIYKI